MTTLLEVLPNDIEHYIFSMTGDDGDSLEDMTLKYWKKRYDNCLKFIDKERLQKYIISSFSNLYDATYKYNVGDVYCLAFYYVFMYSNGRLKTSNGRICQASRWGYCDDCKNFNILLGSGGLFIDANNIKKNIENGYYTKKQEKVLWLFCKILDTY